MTIKITENDGGHYAGNTVATTYAAEKDLIDRGKAVLLDRVNYKEAPLLTDTNGNKVLSGPPGEGGKFLVSQYNSTLFVTGDSIITGTDPTSTSFWSTSAKGSYLDASAVKQRGVMNIFAESPCRMQFRAAHLLNTGDEVWTSFMPSGHPLAHKLFTVTVTAADMVTLDGIDARAMPVLTSGAAATDTVAAVDRNNALSGIFSWFNFFLKQPWQSIQYRPVPGRTSTQIATNIDADLAGGTYTHGLLLCGRNDAAYDETSLSTIKTKMLERCAILLVALPYPDGNWTTPANDADSAKIASTNRYWQQQQALDSRIRVIDLFGAFSDATKVLLGSDSLLLASDAVHPNANGGVVGGALFARTVPDSPRRSASMVTSESQILNGRMGGAAGTVGSGVTGVVATSWTVGNRSGINVAGGFVYTVKMPGKQRMNSIAYIIGDAITTPTTPGFLFVCKTAGTTAAAEPAGLTAGVLWDFTTGVTDGTAVWTKIPVFSTSTQMRTWQLIEYVASAGTNEHLSFYQVAAIPGALGLVVGNRIWAECNLIVYGQCLYSTLQLSCMDAGSVALVRAHDLGANSVFTRWTQDKLDGACKTPVIRIPSTTTQIEVRLRTAFSVSDRVRAFISDMSVKET